MSGTTGTPDQRLAGKVAIVSGAGSGIGQASAALFASHGAKVLAVDRPGVFKAPSDHPAVVQLEQDVTTDDAPEKILGAARERFGGIDILFNNAGTSGRALAHEMTDEFWDRVMAVNLRSMFRICRAAIPMLIDRAQATGRARIINTASVMALDTDYGLSAYTASKHGVAGLTKTLALELGKYRITANYVLPGAILTGMTRATLEQPDIAAVWAKKSALRRLGEPLDIARAALLLASDEADFITGHGLVADGGLRLRS
jgi:NAD(P)-dependent dehydrogenase (short-subunit alcohol dehydrogenase family)